MDVWVLAAAAGAGYVAQRLKGFKSSRHTLVTSESLNLVKPEAPSVLLELQDERCLLHENVSCEIFLEDNCTGREQASQDTSDAETVLTEEFGDKVLGVDKFLSCSTASNLNSLDVSLRNEDIEGDWEGRIATDIDEVANDLLPQTSSREMGFYYDFRRNRGSIRSRQSNWQFIRHQTSLESCLTAHLFNKHTEIENFVYSVHQSCRPKSMPILMTDKSTIISSKHDGSPDTRIFHSQENMSILGVPTLPDIRTKELGKKTKARSGSYDGLHHFYIGLTMGMVSSFLSNEREMGKLAKLLKQTENLVQDLQDELEMKDSLTMKELTVEDCESPEENCDHKSKDESPLSKIEAELEAELERLESHMNSSQVEGKQSNVTDLDPGFVLDASLRELKIDLFDARDSVTPPLPSTQYPISPRELSLRLHEVIQSRLEDRIMELETTLQNNQSNGGWVDWEFSNNKTGTSSSGNSPVTGDEKQSVLNLSGDALAAYDGGVTDMKKVFQSDEDFPFGFEKSYHQEILYQCEQDVDPVLESGRNGYMEHPLNLRGYAETDFRHRKEETHVIPNDVLCGCGSESEDGDDGMEKLLIRQLVEKAKQGSPGFLKAQKALLSTD